MTQRKALVIYTPRDATPESEIGALTAAYRLILDFHANKNAAGVPSTDGGDAMKGSEHDRAIPNHT
jgi:hypothetical protein